MRDLSSKKFDLWVIPKMILFVFISAIVSTPIHIFIEAVICKKPGAPDFITVPFLIYALCAKFIFGLGYVLFGYKLPVKNTFLRAFSYIMLILFTSYLPNILAMIGGDGEIIRSSLSLSIVIVDIISYLLEGLIFGFLMKKYAREKSEVSGRSIKAPKSILLCIVNGVIFASLNILFDIAIGAADSSWRLCNILKVTKEYVFRFYFVFTVFMFIAGFLQPLWYRYCLPYKPSFFAKLFFALELAFVIWLPNVLIMAFFGTSVLKTLVYGVAYIFIIATCVLTFPLKK